MKLSSDLDLASCLRGGDHVIWPQGPGEPLGLTRRLMDVASELPSLTLVVGMVTSGTLGHPEAGRFDYLCLNGAGSARIATRFSRNRVIPAHLSTLPQLIATRRIPIDVLLLRVRPTEDPEILSLGVICDFVHEMAGAARVVIAELDERMPLTRDDALIRRDAVTHLVAADQPEPLLPDPRPSAADLEVAARVAELIPDRATIQFGIGSLPVAVCQALRSHRGLGVHSGVVPDALVDLVEAGVVDNLHKGRDTGLIVTGGLFGSRRLLDFAHGNPSVVMRRVSYTHSQATLACLSRLHTVNSAIEVDLSGQVNAEVAGERYLGAVGGQVDFVRGGQAMPGGRSIMALSSVTPDGLHSKIVPRICGGPVTTSRADIDVVVTEHGHADLRGLDLHSRAKALVAIAHPQFRDSLAKDLAILT